MNMIKDLIIAGLLSTLALVYYWFWISLPEYTLSEELRFRAYHPKRKDIILKAGSNVQFIEEDDETIKLKVNIDGVNHIGYISLDEKQYLKRNAP